MMCLLLRVAQTRWEVSPHLRDKCLYSNLQNSERCYNSSLPSCAMYNYKAFCKSLAEDKRSEENWHWNIRVRESMEKRRGGGLVREEEEKSKGVRGGVIRSRDMQSGEAEPPLP